VELERWLAFAVAALLVSLSPGAGAINTISQGLQLGVKRSLPGSLGLQLGYGIQIALVGVGLGTLLSQSALAFSLIKWFGVAYLLWLGYQKWTQPVLSMEQAQQQQDSASKQFAKATLVNLANPKATIFLLALFAQFIDAGQQANASQYLIMGATLIGTDILVMIGYASLAASLAKWMQHAHHQKRQNRVFGLLFAGTAAMMAGYSA